LEVSPKKVLVAEADEIVLVLITHALSRYFRVVHRCGDGLELEPMLRSESYDAVLVDLKLADGGPGLLRRLIDRDPSLQRKLIVMTMCAEDGRALDGIPVAAVVRKPVELYDLIDTVRTVSRE